MLILIRGPPGSGKTTVARELHARIPSILLETDHLLKAISFSPQKHTKRAFLNTSIKHYLYKGHTIIIEGIYGGPRASGKIGRLERIAQEAGAAFHVITLDCDIDTCITRCASRDHDHIHIREDVITWHDWFVQSDYRAEQIISCAYPNEKIVGMILALITKNPSS